MDLELEKLLTANIILDIFCILLCLMPILYLTSAQRYKIKLNRYFMGICVANALMILGDLGDWAIRDITSSGAKTLLIVLTVNYYVSSALVLLFISNYIKEYLKLTKKQSRLFITTVAVLCSIQIFLAVVSPFTGSVFLINEDGYNRGNLFLLAQAIPFINMALCITCINLNRRKLTGRELVFFYLYLLLPQLSMVIQVLFRGINIVSPIITLNMLIMFINIQYEHELVLRQREKELAELQIDILLSQIQPHFLYNSLGTIYQLCESDPTAARKSVKEFSTFLRSNMDSLKAREPIPFEKELGHVKNYLNLERRRFQDRLEVRYNIEATGFYIPPLSLQPLVENAVRHGIFHRSDGGQITISTRATGEYAVVTIEDNGVGMEKSKEYPEFEDHAHIGLANVRSRIETMVNGSMEVESSDKGTTVTIRIPWEGGF